jgi:hypothetical protein
VSVTPLLSLSLPDDNEAGLIQAMLNRLQVVAGANSEAESFYDGSHVARNFGISIPPVMRNLQTVAGWGGTVVDVLEERLDWLGWGSDGDDFGLSEVYAQNSLDVDSGMAHLDALIFGVSFLTVGTGVDGEPSPLITPHSPKSMTCLWDARRRRVAAALAVVVEDGQAVEVTLYEDNTTSRFERRSGMWVAADRDRHNAGRPLVVQMPNRIRGSRDAGRSEITRAVRYYTEAAERTLLGLEVNREFYNAPQRVGLNVNQEDFVDETGAPVSQWSAVQGQMLMAPPNEEGAPEPKFMQFDPASPAPYIDQVKGYATLLAAEAGIPAAYLGFTTDNPASADAIRAGEARLVKRAERRQTVFGRAWTEAGRLALLVRDGVVPDSFDAVVSNRWRDASTPTRAAAADEATKLIASGVLPADSSVTYDRIGLSPAEQRQVGADKRRAAGRALLSAITPPAPVAPAVASDGSVG